MAANKVQFGIKNLHYATITNTGGVISYGTITAVPGSVSISLDMAGSIDPFYADNQIYYNSVSNNGYTGTLELAKVTDKMLEDIFGYTLEATDKVLTEDATVEPKAVALLFEIDGDNQDEKYLFYNVTLSRPHIGSATTTDTKDVQTQSIDFSAIPSIDTNAANITLARTTDATPSGITSTWYTTIWTP